MFRTTLAFMAGIIVGTAPLLVALRQPQPASLFRSGTGVVQLRLFTIDKGRLDDFAAAWSSGVYPLRRKLGYEIPFAAKIPQTNQFVWVLVHNGAEPWNEKEAAYYGSDERKRLSPDPAQWIARTEQYFVDVVPGIPRP